MNAKPRKLVKCPECKAAMLKRTKEIVVFGMVPVFCMACGAENEVDAVEWRRGQGKNEK